MKLVTKAIEKSMPKMYETEEIPTSEKVVRAKFFDAWGSATWYGVEYDKETGNFMGYCTGLQVDEWGYFNIHELAKFKKFGVPRIERDMFFTPTKFGDLKL